MDQQAYVLRTIEERRVRLVRLWFTDVLGQLKSLAISPVELETAFEEGVQFDGSAIDGFSRVVEDDVLAVPDPASFQLMSWADGEVTGRMFCDLVDLDRQPFEGDPRQVLKRNLERARAAGFDLMCSPEVEFFYLATDDASQGVVLLDNASYFDLTTYDASSDIRRETIQRLENLGIPVEYSFHEDAPSQHEIDLRYTDGLSMADNLMTLRLVVKEVALVRVPLTKRGKEPLGTRIEYRAIDPACNPYLAFSVLLAAGLAGIEGDYELGDEARPDLVEMSEPERRTMGIGVLPTSLAEALDRMEGSELARDALGEHIFEWFLRNKRSEWNDYKAHVSQFELDRYLRHW